MNLPKIYLIYPQVSSEEFAEITWVLQSLISNLNFSASELLILQLKAQLQALQRVLLKNKQTDLNTGMSWEAASKSVVQWDCLTIPQLDSTIPLKQKQSWQVNYVKSWCQISRKYFAGGGGTLYDCTVGGK